MSNAAHVLLETKWKKLYILFVSLNYFLLVKKPLKNPKNYILSYSWFHVKVAEGKKSYKIALAF